MESINMFDSGGYSTCGEFHCDMCGATYNLGADESEDYTDQESVGHDEFAGLDVCYSCIRRIEEEIIRRRYDVAKWLGKILENEIKQASEAKQAIEGKYD